MFAPDMTVEPFKRTMRFLSGHDAARIRPGDSRRMHPRRLAADAALALLGNPATFKRTVRLFPFYERCGGSVKGVTPGLGETFATEFVVVTDKDRKAISVTVVDPRTPALTHIALSDFLKRQGAYWEKHFPTGWAGIESVCLPAPSPDLQRAVYTACLTAAESKGRANVNTVGIAKALRRLFGVDATATRAKPTMAMLLKLCSIGRRGDGTPAWTRVPGSSTEWRTPLFAMLELKHVGQYMLSSNTGGRVHTPRARIEQSGELPTVRWVIAASFMDVATAEIAQCAADIASHVATVTLDDLLRADPRAKHDLDARAQKRGLMAAGPAPPCVSNVLYPSTPKKGVYPKNAARWRVAAVVKETAHALGVSPEAMVDFPKMFAHWAAHPTESMRKLHDDITGKSRLYTTTCRAMHEDAHNCPFGGDVRKCTGGNTFAGGALPVQVWIAPRGSDAASLPPPAKKKK